MNLWGHRFSQNANQKLQGILPYYTNKDRWIFFCDFLVSVGSFLAIAMILICLVGQKSLKFLVGILGQTMTSLFNLDNSEFNWPLNSQYFWKIQDIHIWLWNILQFRPRHEKTWLHKEKIFCNCEGISPSDNKYR